MAKKEKREGRTLDISGKPSDVVSVSLLGQAIRRGWQITPERKRQYFAALDQTVRDLDGIEDPAKRGQVAAQCVRVLVAEQDAALRDLHQQEKDKRLDAGLATENIGAVAFRVPGLEVKD